MYKVVVVSGRTGRSISRFFLCSVLFVVTQLSAFAAGSVNLAWNPTTDSTVVGFNIYYGGASATYTNEFSVGMATNATISGLVPGATYYFAATTYNAAGLESPFSAEISYLVPPIV
ncbi:MAG: fibronectin type III domain-containing protein, partial [Limisphaerales bacterium]